MKYLKITMEFKMEPRYHKKMLSPLDFYIVTMYW